MSPAKSSVPASRRFLQERPDHPPALAEIVLDFLVSVHSSRDLFVAVRPHIAPLVALGGREIEIPVIAALDRDRDEPTLKWEVGLKLPIERTLGKLREHRSIHDVDPLHAWSSFAVAAASFSAFRSAIAFSNLARLSSKKSSIRIAGIDPL